MARLFHYRLPSTLFEHFKLLILNDLYYLNLGKCMYSSNQNALSTCYISLFTLKNIWVSCSPYRHTSSCLTVGLLKYCPFFCVYLSSPRVKFEVLLLLFWFWLVSVVSPHRHKSSCFTIGLNVVLFCDYLSSP